MTNIILIRNCIIYLFIISLLQESFARLDERLDALEKKVRAKLAAQGFPESHIKTESFLHLRYERTDCALMCTASQDTKRKGTKHGDFLSTFLER